MQVDLHPTEPASHTNGARFPNPHGLSLFPLQANSKRPCEEEFWAAASSDASKIPLGRNAGVITGNGLIVLDLDVKHGKNGIETLGGLVAIYGDLPATLTVETPTGGQHRYFRDPLGRDFGQGNDRLGNGIDVKAHSHGYVVAAGSVIDGKAYVIIDDRPIADAPEWLIAELLRSAPRSRGTVEQIPLVEPDTEENIALATDWLIDKAPEAGQGERNDTAAKIIAPKLKDFGLSPDMAFELALEHWNETKVSPPCDLDELETAIHSGYRSATQNRPGILIAQLAKNEFPPLPQDYIDAIDAQRAPQRTTTNPASPGSSEGLNAPITWAKCVGEPPHRQWVWGDMVPDRQVTLLYGDGGTGKTLLAQQLAAMIATPKHLRREDHNCFLGQKVTPGRVLALFCEDDEDELWRRQVKINDALGLSMGDLERLSFVSGYGYDNLLMTFDRGVSRLTQRMQQLRNECAAFKPSLVILDNLADMFGGNEIVRLEANQFIKTGLGGIIKDHNCAVLLLAHPSKSGLSTGSGDSGSTAWSNSVRSRLYLRKMDNKKPGYEKNARVLIRMKGNYAPEDDSGMLLRWHNGTWTRAIEQSQSFASMDDHEKQHLVLEAMTRLIASNVDLSPSTHASTSAARRLRSANEIAGVGMSKGQIELAIDALLAAGKIHIGTYRKHRRYYDCYKIGGQPDGGD